MSTKESQHTKETLKDNKDSFKKLESTLDGLRADFQKKIMKEIHALDVQEQKEVNKLKARKRALALKGIVKGSYVEDERASEQVPVDGQVKEGTIVFMKNCSTCHSLEAIDHRPMKGPSLGLIYNRRAGANVNFDTYTDSMIKRTHFWTALNLYRFMATPNVLVPKTTCGLSRHPLHSEQDRADLITMFREFTTEMAFNVRLKQIERIGYNSFQTNMHSEQEERKRGQARDQREKNLDKKI